jgi:hypothetical protein
MLPTGSSAARILGAWWSPEAQWLGKISDPAPQSLTISGAMRREEHSRASDRRNESPHNRFTSLCGSQAQQN